MKRITKTLSVIITAVLIIAAMPFTAMADGAYYVDNTYMVLKPGQTGTITISAENAAGRVDWTASGAVSASGSAFLDNGVATIEVTGVEAGTGFITVTPTDLATYDGEVLSTPYMIQVDVVGEDGGYTEGNNNQAAAAEQPVEQPVEQPAEAVPAPEQPAEEQPREEAQAQDAAEEEQPEEEQPAEEQADDQPVAEGEVLTDGNSDYENLEEEDRLYTTVDGTERYIIRFPIWLDEEGNNVWNDEVFNLDRLSGFELGTVNYKGVNVDCFRYKDLMEVFVLKNLETDECQYCVLENGVGFKPLSYISVNGKQYIVVDFPEDFQIPEGYQMVEMTLGSNTVHALKKISGEAAPAVEQPEENVPEAEEEAAPAEEPDDTAYGGGFRIVLDKRNKVMLKGYEEVVNPGLDSTDPSGDLYYIFCLVDGKTQLYSYDSGEGTLQRASIVVYNEVPTEPETVIVYETVTAPAEQPETAAGTVNEPVLKGIGWAGMQIQVKVLLIALAVAILLIIILIILFASMSRRNKKNNSRNRHNSRNIPPRARDNGGDDDGFFSYVKTEADDFDLEELK